jgi:hypothetical protein
MKKLVYFLVFLFVASMLMADWDPTESHGMHYPQMPDPLGYDVDCNDPHILADDFLCTLSGPIREIHIWISQRYLLEPIPPPPPPILNIHLSIHSDIPAGILEPWSMPGELLWQGDFTAAEFIIREPAYEGDQGWFDPWIPMLWLNDHLWYWQVNIEPIMDPFIQVEGEIYWLDVSIDSPEEIGWKTSLDHWNDDAVYYDENFPPNFWRELIDPEPPFESLDLAFVIGGDDYPKPVELSSFTTLYTNGNAILNWTTQSETNNIGWNVYRGESETALENNTSICLNNSGLILGAGTTTEPTNYQFTDEYDVIVGQTYWYWLESVDGAGSTEIYGSVTLTIPEDEPVPQLPQTTFLCSNYPNPFNPDTKIEFTIKEGENGSLSIYNAKGQLLETHQYEAGEYELTWDAVQYGSGIYFYKLETQSYTETKKMIMLK